MKVYPSALITGAVIAAVILSYSRWGDDLWQAIAWPINYAYEKSKTQSGPLSK